MTPSSDKKAIDPSDQTDFSSIRSQLTSEEYQAFQRWVALGVGGLPHTLEGFRTLQSLHRKRRNPLDVSHLAPLVGQTGDLRALDNLPQRSGPRPTVAPFAIPHRQTDQHNSPIIREKQKTMFDEVVEQNQALVHYGVAQRFLQFRT